MSDKEIKKMKKNELRKTAGKTAVALGNIVKIGIGAGLILANVAMTAVGAILCAITLQD